MTVASVLGATPPPITEQAEQLENIWWFYVVLASLVGVIVFGLIFFVMVKYRRKDDSEPTQRQYNNKIEMTYTIVPLVIVIVLFFVSLQGINRVEAKATDPDVTVDVTAFQWQWQFDYPDSGARSESINRGYPELVLPTNSTVQFNLSARDVVHSFWVPGFRFKRDIFPGKPTSFSVDVGDTTGTWDDGVCAEMCGLDHANMRFTIRVVTPEEFATWQADNQATGSNESSQ